MKIIALNGGVFQTNAYLVADEVAGEAVLFDAPDHTGAELARRARAEGWHLAGLWLTHGHIDHVADHAAVTTEWPEAKVLLHPADAEKLRDPLRGLPWRLPFEVNGREADGALADGQELRIGSIAVRVLHTPGHSPGHVCFHLYEQKVLIGGDLIICGAVGRTDFPDASERQLQASIRRVMQLDRATSLLPGHCEASTLGEEADGNPHVRAALVRG